MAATERVAKRVLIDIRKSSNYRDDAWVDPSNIIGIALEALKKKNIIPQETENNESDVRLIIKTISSLETRIVFDIFHDTFDATQAHLYGQDLPVVIVSMPRGEHRKVFNANVSQTRKVNFEIRFLFNRYGVGSQPPFSEDFRRGPAWSIPFKSFRDSSVYHAQRQDEIAAKK